MYALAFSRSTLRRRMASMISSLTVCWMGSTAMGAAALASASQSARTAAADADGLGHDLDAVTPGWPSLLPLALVEKHELQNVEIGRQHQQVIEVAFAQHPHQVIADFGRLGLGLGEDDPEEMLR